MTSAPIKVLLADDHPLVREGIRASLATHDQVRIVGEASSGEEAVQLAQKLSPDVVLMDLTMPGIGGFEATKRLRKVSPKARCIIVSMHAEREYVRQVAACGAKGYVLKDSPPQHLLQAIEAVHGGRTYFTPSVSETLLSEMIQSGDRATEPPFAKLTERETEVLRLVADGFTNKQIALRLAISVRTVETHRERVMDKLNIRTVAGLTKYALAKGLIPLK
jgi:two-component system, NarL family, nitrate/nitrite response regulator NarL